MYPHNSRTGTILKAAFPMDTDKGTKLFIRVKSSDPEKLDIALSNFLSNFILQAQEFPIMENFKDDLTSAHFTVGHVGSNVIFCLPLESTSTGQSATSVANDAMEMIRNLELQFSTAFSTATTLKSILEAVWTN